MLCFVFFKFLPVFFPSFSRIFPICFRFLPVFFPFRQHQFFCFFPVPLFPFVGRNFGIFLFTRRNLVFSRGGFHYVWYRQSRVAVRGRWDNFLQRDSLEKHVRSDFRLIFHAYTQTLNLDFEATLWCFWRFFAGRLFFERVGALKRKRMEKGAKSHAEDGKFNQKSA